MGCILIVMPRYEDSSRIADIISRSGTYAEHFICSSGNEVLRKVAEQDVSVVICTKTLSDMGYEELSTYLPAKVNLLLLTKDAGLIPFSSNIVRVLLPFKVDDLISTLRMLIPDSFYKPKPAKPKRSAEEQKVIDEAKAVLMDRNSMTEPEAFRYIQKTSMDMGRTMLESAQMILAMNIS